jgi:hypothetical protein
MELQALRYAAMVSTMTFAQAALAHARYLQQRGLAGDEPEAQARAAILQFLGWEEPQEEGFAANVRIVLAAQDFHRELTTTVMWLLERELDICCIRLTPYKLQTGELVLNVDQVIPLPEAADYQIRVREKRQRERADRSRQGRIKIDLTLGAESWARLSKRDAMLQLFLHLHRAGVSPTQMAEVIPWRKPRSFFLALDGTLDSEQYCAAADGLVIGTRRTFRPKEWFCRDDQLMHHDGQTWCLSKRWGNQTPKAIGNLINLARNLGLPGADSMEFQVHED